MNQCKVCQQIKQDVDNEDFICGECLHKQLNATDDSSFAFGQSVGDESNIKRFEVMASWFESQGVHLDALDLKDLKAVYDAVIAVGRVAEGQDRTDVRLS